MYTGASSAGEEEAPDVPNEGVEPPQELPPSSQLQEPPSTQQEELMSVQPKEALEGIADNLLVMDSTMNVDDVPVSSQDIVEVHALTDRGGL